MKSTDVCKLKKNKITRSRQYKNDLQQKYKIEFKKMSAIRIKITNKTNLVLE